jgi:hypothetical protein
MLPESERLTVLIETNTPIMAGEVEGYTSGSRSVYRPLTLSVPLSG